MNQELAIFDYFAAALLESKGVPLVRITPGQVVVFYFSNLESAAEKVLNEWRSGRATVQVTPYVKSLKRLKHIVHTCRANAAMKVENEHDSTISSQQG